MKPIRHRRKGFVLLYTIALIALAAVVLTGLARQSVLLATEAVRAEEDVQHRWAVLSCKRTLLMQASDILDRIHPSTPSSTERPAEVAIKVTLNNMTYDLLLADEEAKINLNTICHLRGDADVSRWIRQQSTSGLAIRLRPYQYRSEDIAGPVFDSWGQVFAENLSENIETVPDVLNAATSNITCWGSGKLNLARVSNALLEQLGEAIDCPAAMRNVIEGRQAFLLEQEEKKKLASQMEQATAPADTSPKVDWPKNGRTSSSNMVSSQSQFWLKDFINRLALRESERRTLEEVLTDHSTCYSLWISIRSTKRSWHCFSVATVVTEGSPKIRDYLW